MIFVIFDDFWQILDGELRGSVKRYGHIYFLDRSRCDLFESSRIWLGLKGFGSANWEIRLRTMYGGCAWCELTLAPLRTGPCGPEIESLSKSKGGEHVKISKNIYFRCLQFDGQPHWDRPQNHHEIEKSNLWNCEKKLQTMQSNGRTWAEIHVRLRFCISGSHSV